MSNVSKVDKKVSKVLDEQVQADDNVIRLSSGVELYAQQANPNILIRVMTAVKRPEPPQVFIKAMGRYMENSDDPDYKKRVEAWNMDYNSAMLNALVGLGTRIKFIPKGTPKPEDDSWIADYKALGLPVIEDSKSWRYISWVLFIAAPKDTDMTLIGEKVKALSGVKEADVRDAENFPGSDEADG